MIKEVSGGTGGNGRAPLHGFSPFASADVGTCWGMIFHALLRTGRRTGAAAFAVIALQWVNVQAEPAALASNAPRFTSRADSPPRKVVVASAVARFAGTVEERLALAGRLIDQAAETKTNAAVVRGLDLVVLPRIRDLS